MLRTSLLAFTLLSAATVTALADPAPAPTAPPAPPPTAVEIQVDVTDSVGGAAAAAPSFTGAVSLALNDCGAVEAGNGTGHYEIHVCYEIRNANTPPLLSVEVERTIHGHADLHQKVKTTAAVAPGRRIVLGRFGQGSDSTEVAATVK
jgi:hypothetical protein